MIWGWVLVPSRITFKNIKVMLQYSETRQMKNFKLNLKLEKENKFKKWSREREEEASLPGCHKHTVYIDIFVKGWSVPFVCLPFPFPSSPFPFLSYLLQIPWSSFIQLPLITSYATYFSCQKGPALSFLEMQSTLSFLAILYLPLKPVVLESSQLVANSWQLL